MAEIWIGSARVDEKGTYSGGKAGDQKQKSIIDIKGEVSMQIFNDSYHYVKNKGLYVIRPKNPEQAKRIAERMGAACNNKNLGYDQGQRGGVIIYGIDSKISTECDCSSLVRACVKEATGIDPGNFTTADAATKLANTGLFEAKFSFVSLKKTPVYDGDIMVTKTKGHIVIVVAGSPRPTAGSNVSNTNTTNTAYYPVYSGKSNSLVDALKAVGEKDTSMEHRKKIAAVNNIKNYNGGATQNTEMLTMLRLGNLKKEVNN